MAAYDVWVKENSFLDIDDTSARHFRNGVGCGEKPHYGWGVPTLSSGRLLCGAF